MNKEKNIIYKLYNWDYFLNYEFSSLEEAEKIKNLIIDNKKLVIIPFV